MECLLCGISTSSPIKYFYLLNYPIKRGVLTLFLSMNGEANIFIIPPKIYQLSPQDEGSKSSLYIEQVRKDFCLWN
jgi:hypothetical protein